MYFGQVLLSLQISSKFSERLDFTALTCVIAEHFVHLFQIIAGDTVGNDMYGVTGLGHVEAGGFHAGGGIRTGNIKLVYAVCLDKCGKFFTCQSVALLEQERTDEAIPHLEKAVELKPREELAQLVLAVAYEKAGTLDKAIKAYDAVRRVTRIRQNKKAASEKIEELQNRLSEK
jgi:tetratricopeptide (TPR) repeat protein